MNYILGVDESGTGAWAGPFYVSAVLAPMGWSCAGVRDSKKTTAAERVRLVELIDAGVVHSSMEASAKDINEKGHSNMYFKALTSAVVQVLRWCPVPKKNVRVVIDGSSSRVLVAWLTSQGLDFNFMPRADQTVQAVSAASILAKFNRDVEMSLLDKKHPEYAWAKNAGYGTVEHALALKTYGATPFHRHVGPLSAL